MEIEAVCKKGEIIFREGDASNNTYIIKSGQIEISKGIGNQKIVLAVLKEGDVFGEMGLIEEKPRSATATALEDTRMAVIDHDTFNELFLKNPASLVPFFKAVFERLRTMNQMLLQKAHTAPPETPPGRETPPQAPPAQEEAVVKVAISGVSEAAKKALGNTAMAIAGFPFKVGRVSSHTSDVLSSNDLCLHDNPPYNISRNHFSINLTGNKVYITDRGSTLGTIVNGRKAGGETPILLDKPRNLVIAGGPQSPFQFEVEVTRQ